MANLDNVSDVFTGATVSGGNVVIPTGQLPKFNQGDNVAEGAELISATNATKVPAGALSGVRAMIRLPENPGHYLIRADIKSDGIDVRDWIESTVTVKADEE